MYTRAHQCKSRSAAIKAKTLKKVLFILPLNSEQQKDGEYCMLSKCYESTSFKGTNLTSTSLQNSYQRSLIKLAGSDSLGYSTEEEITSNCSNRGPLSSVVIDHETSK